MMTVNQANAVNELCSFLLGKLDSGDLCASEARARDALAILAGDADKRLHAGWTAPDVQRRWRKGVNGGAGRFRGRQ